jgi:D-alanyl-D-alanine dipeptidase
LVESAAQQLAKAAELFAGQLLRLVIWDAYRPEAVQEQLRAVNADERYVLSESNHTKGLAIDLTLATPDGVYLPMGSDFDDFSERAHTDFVDLTEVERTNRSQLRQVMEQVGFQGWPYEWWHFNYVGSN